jgi:hypothetical protein
LTFPGPLQIPRSAAFYPAIKALGLPSKMKLYVVRVSGNDPDKLLNSRPCKNCIEYMKLFGVKYVFYSNETGEITKEKVDTMESLHESLAVRIYYKKILDTKKSPRIYPKESTSLDPAPS